MNGVQYISAEEKKQIFDRQLEIENKIDDFINEAQEEINNSIEKLNEFNGRLMNLEAKFDLFNEFNGRLLKIEKKVNLDGGE